MSTSQGGVITAADAEIAERITNALIIKNVTVRALSNQTEISYPTLRRSLKGDRSFTFQEFGKIAAAIGVHPSALLPDTLVARDVA